MDWDEFITQYAEEILSDEDSDEADAQEIIEELEYLHENPLNINAAVREDLLRLPFMDESRTDSLLLYRQRKGGYFRTLGELQFVSELSYDDRCRLSLFLYVGPRDYNKKEKKEHPWRDGHHEMATRFDIPLYRTAGQTPHTAKQAQEKPNKYYTGYPLSNTTRYNYNYQNRLRYGVTLQKDSGEPFGSRGSHTYPFDYNALHFYYRPRRGNYEVAVGDYRIHLGEGLLVGGSSQRSRTALLTQLSSSQLRISPHTGTEESRFFRGAAGSYRFALPQQYTLRLTAFASVKPLDGTMNGDTLTSFKTDGQHRTLSELRKRNVITNLTGGLDITLSRRQWQVGLSGVWSHYNHTVYPVWRYYNHYYMRGQDAAGISAHYSFLHGRWQVQGEAALDRHGHLATTHTLRWRHGGRASWFFQGRILSPKFVTPWGNALSQDSRNQNEIAVLSGGTWQCAQRFTLDGYLEYFRRPKPSYRAHYPSQGVEGRLQGLILLTPHHKLLLRYQTKIKQQDVTGHDLMQYIGTHRLKMQWDATYRKVDFHLTADAALYTTQTTTTEKGMMLSGRVRWQPLPALRLSAFAAIFNTDSYNTRLYSYMPHLPRSSTSMMAYNKGWNAACTAEYSPLKWLNIGVQYRFLHYFNRSTISSGVTEIGASSRNDLQVQMILKF